MPDVGLVGFKRHSEDRYLIIVQDSGYLGLGQSIVVVVSGLGHSDETTRLLLHIDL